MFLTSKFGAVLKVADMETSAALGSAKQDRTDYGDMPVRRSVANDHALGARKFNLPGFLLWPAGRHEEARQEPRPTPAQSGLSVGS